MHPDRHLMTTMKNALTTMNADLIRATDQARQRSRVMEAHAAGGSHGCDGGGRRGTSYLQVLSETCTALDSMCEAYDGLRTLIERRTAAC
jgi:hypothetical protein